MKNIGCFLIVLFHFITLIGCPNGNYALLPDIDFSVSPQKNSYTIGEEMELIFTQIPDFTMFGKYSFEIELKEFDEENNEYIKTNKIIFFPDECDSVYFEYEEDDVVCPLRVEKSFSMKAIQKGKFLALLHGNGYIYNDKGGYSAVGYDKSLYIDVIE